MIICKNFVRILFRLLIVTILIQGVIPTKCLWELLYDIGLMLTARPPDSRATKDPLFDIWGETEVCYPDNTREQHQKNFGPPPKTLKHTDGFKKKGQVTNRVEISTNIEKPKVAVDIKTPLGDTQVTVKHKTNITLKADPAAPPTTNSNYYTRISSETTILICFLALVVAIALYLSFCLYQEKKQKKTAANANSVQSITASSADAEESDTEINEILLDDISNLTSTMMVRTYLESLVTELKNTHTKESIKKYITDDFLTMVSEKIARDAYMRMNFMESITAESLMRLAHLYNLTGMRQRQSMSNFLGLPLEKNINVSLKFGQGFQLKTKIDSPKNGATPEDQTREVKKDGIEDGATANQPDVEQEAIEDVATSTPTEDEKEAIQDGATANLPDVEQEAIEDVATSTPTEDEKEAIQDGATATQDAVEDDATQTDTVASSLSFFSSSSSSSDTSSEVKKKKVVPTE